MAGIEDKLDDIIKHLEAFESAHESLAAKVNSLTSVRFKTNKTGAAASSDSGEENETEVTFKAEKASLLESLSVDSLNEPLSGLSAFDTDNLQAEF